MPSTKSKARKEEPDFGEFPPGSVTTHSTLLCLACIFDLFTQQLGLAPRTAYLEIRRHSPTVEELTSREPQRPYFASASKNPRCPYCDSAKRWHARLTVHRVEGGKWTDAPRRALVKNLPTREEQFQVVERKTTARAVFFEWLERMGRQLDFEDDHSWMLDAARSYLERREPKTDWAEIFADVSRVRRSARLEEGWELDGQRLFLSPALYAEVLLVQYLVSRSHRHGGETFEGRLTLHELLRRVRHTANLETTAVAPTDQFEILEQLVSRLAGGDASAKLHFIIDRRDLLDKVKTVHARYAA